MTNRLAQSQSLYLRKHAENPIDWWPWCDEAIATARATHRPIFLSIGYSSCHWCTVMEGEAFSDGAIADYMNEHFLPIKVDREERPDIDSIYMQTLQMMTGQGGWPLNVFLSPDDLLPFYGGTYFPLEPRYGRPGFFQVLQAIRNFFDTETEKLSTVKEKILAQLQQVSRLQASGSLEDSQLRQGLDYSAGILSSRDTGPSFPMIPYALAALRGDRLSGDDTEYDARELCYQRGLSLALGGIYDHVAGGFHRYTVDATWTVPHFEKMLYDNGQIVEYLADLWAAGLQEPAFEQAIAGTVDWLKREMLAEPGFFYAAQDADSFVTPEQVEPEEGAFYVWSYEELAQFLAPDDLDALESQPFTISPPGNFEGQNVLQRLTPGALLPAAKTALGKLFTVRYGAPPEQVSRFAPARDRQDATQTAWPGRIPPVTDTKMIAAWNSLMISGLARAAAVFQQPDYLTLASQTAQFILDHQWVGDRFHRLNYEGQAAVLAQSEDYALFIKALIDVHQGAIALDPTAAPSWLERAIAVQAEFDEFLWSIELGGYYNTDARNDLVVRERSFEDNATPSANGIAIANLMRLFLLTENLDYLDRAEQGLTAFAPAMVQAPRACPTLFAALDWFRNPTLVRTQPELIPALAAAYHPTTIYQVAPHLPEGAVGMVCQGLSCKAPASDVQMLLDQLQQIERRSP
ncbi:thioredoxin domain-containing protein [Leptolyngbya sp. CCY15150]|uniref:thioredoxin domain-containing protein n=1 Tax=Leptolyngbya sp. CCY15150 TaxID=2767772 RepID=UPI00194FFEFE|nr:thioredoxin domain-containing protein [Leptolyngbya sp. CCY15150]